MTHYRLSFFQPSRRLKMAVYAAFSALVGLGLAAPGLAVAQEPTFVEQSRDWDVFTTTIEGSPACFIVSKPRSYDPMPESRHGDVVFYMSRRPAASIAAEPMVLVGYSFQEGSQVTVNVGGTAFTFLTQGPRAFLNNPTDGDGLLSAMRAGSDMRVTGTSSRGTNVSYVFSLSGVTAGTNRTAQDCPV